MVTFRVEIATVALELLRRIQDRRVREALEDRIEGLTHDPEKQGKALHGGLSGYRSVRAMGRRYRIIYRVDRGRVVVLVVSVGLRKEGDRKDIYELAERLVRLGLAGR